MICTMLDKVLERYKIYGLFTVEEFGNDNYQHTYKITVSSKSFFMKISQNQFANPISIKNRYYVMNELEKKKIITPKIIKTSEEENYIVYGGNFIEIFEWMQLIPYCDDMFYKCVDDLCDVFQAYDKIEYGNWLNARMIDLYKKKLIDNLKISTFPYFNIKKPIIDDKLIEIAVGYLNSIYEQLEDQIILMPVKYIHGDLNKTNLAYYKGKLCVHDLDTTRLGLRIEDIAFSFYSICIESNSPDDMNLKTNYFLKKIQLIYPMINLKMLLFFLIKKILNVIESQVEAIEKGKKAPVLEMYVKGLAKVCEKFIYR